MPYVDHVVVGGRGCCESARSVDHEGDVLVDEKVQVFVGDVERQPHVAVSINVIFSATSVVLSKIAHAVQPALGDEGSGEGWDIERIHQLSVQFDLALVRGHRRCLIRSKAEVSLARNERTDEKGTIVAAGKVAARVLHDASVKSGVEASRSRMSTLLDYGGGGVITMGGCGARGCGGGRGGRGFGRCFGG